MGRIQRVKFKAEGEVRHLIKKRIRRDKWRDSYIK